MFLTRKKKSIGITSKSHRKEDRFLRHTSLLSDWWLSAASRKCTASNQSNETKSVPLCFIFSLSFFPTFSFSFVTVELAAGSRKKKRNCSFYSFQIPFQLRHETECVRRINEKIVKPKCWSLVDNCLFFGKRRCLCAGNYIIILFQNVFFQNVEQLYVIRWH